MDTNVFILSWDCYGLEACVDVTDKVQRGNDFEREKIWDLLKDPDNEPRNDAVKEINKIFFTMSMRARYNPQRHYEIYSIHTNPDITERDLASMFDNAYQGSADLIRERGTTLYSDRSTTERVIT